MNKLSFRAVVAFATLVIKRSTDSLEATLADMVKAPEDWEAQTQGRTNEMPSYLC